jgi:glycerol-3-phosphate dehydrogenase
MPDKPVVILGGGINGAAAARELVLNGQSVWLIDSADLAFGATAYSSRLIHGGLRYLEFGEFSLVKESLDERARLLRLAPHLVKPLRLFIPVQNQWGGFVQAGLKFFNLLPKGTKPASRGLRVVQLGLGLYDWYSQGGGLPPRSLHRIDEPDAPNVSPAVARKLWAYSDAQISYPERLVIAFLADAKQLAWEKGLDFRVFTYRRATRNGSSLDIQPTAGQDIEPITIQPSAIINATGAWVDSTLTKLPATSRRLMGGTKGSHFLTFQPRIAELLHGQGIYTEARDGRPVFLLPFNTGTLIGTTDIPFTGDPADVVATEDELQYLLSVVNDTFPTAGLDRADIAMHQCGVRPLPYVDAKTPAAITRRHQLVWNDESPVPLVSLVGGKLTTCRSLAEETAAAVLSRLNKTVTANSRDRPIPPSKADELLANQTAHAWLPSADITKIIADEWVTTLEDLVERRLVLHFSKQLSRENIHFLADELVRAQKLTPTDAPTAINHCLTRLKSHFGILV